MTTNANSPEHKDPSIEAFENLLHQFQPTPSQRFYRRMQKAPWFRQPVRGLTSKWMYASLLIGCLVVACFLILPPLRAMARNWIQYFMPDQYDNIQVSLGDLSPESLFQYGSVNNFPYSIEHVSQQAGFQIAQPAAFLPGMVLIGARYEEASHTVVLLYQGAGYNLFLSQRKIETGQELFSIGASAAVEEVSIGDIRGEYVSGGWVNLSGISTAQSDGSHNLQVVWDESLPQHTLRWQSDEFAFQLRSTGSKSLQKLDLIALAQTIQ